VGNIRHKKSISNFFAREIYHCKIYRGILELKPKAKVGPILSTAFLVLFSIRPIHVKLHD